MKNIFLYRLFKQSKIFFIFSIFFILGYCIVLKKQMDMLFFPLNNMFSTNTATTYTSITYGFKINGNLLETTNQFYLKKDFSEGSLLAFSSWIKNDGNNYITTFLKNKITDSVRRAFFLNKLSPPKNIKFTWPRWYAKFNHTDISDNDLIELWEYKFDMNDNKFVLMDSTLILKEIGTHE